MKKTHTACSDAYPLDHSDLMPHLPDAQRRQLLKLMGATGAIGAASGLLAPLTAIAQTTTGTDYKAMVCLFMYGGNDANNMVVPRDTAGYALYRTGRTNLALQQQTLLPLSTTPAATPETDTAPYGLHPAMTGLAGLYTQRKMAVIANVGPLMVPTTKAQWNARSVPLPEGLFSHSDQQDAWQSAIYDGGMTKAGWGGRMMERLVAQGSPNRGYCCISLAGGNLWETGDVSLLGYKVSSSGNFGFNFFNPTGTDPLSTAIQQTLTDQRSHLFHQAWLTTMGRSIDVQKTLNTALNGSTVTTPFPNSGLGNQLRTVARLVAARGAIGLTRQVFFVSIGGFDTHGDDQLQQQQRLFGEISAAVTAFEAATTELGVSDKVTLFTASDFGRTFASNGQGSDHGWGSHQFVVGGAVRGGAMYGSMPDHTLNGPSDTGTGRWIPTTASDQMSSTLARWFGADTSVINTVLPRIPNFNADLGFMV
ncbi:MAG: hypothetical protein RLZZ618_2814 [Pseudomonadota bacterium]|jgi:uncharacterized protein (DUF1501 family)